jgi:hypothetical protein
MIMKFLNPACPVTDACVYLRGGVSTCGQTGPSTPEFVGSDELGLLRVVASKHNFPFVSVTLSSNDAVANIRKAGGPSP